MRKPKVRASFRLRAPKTPPTPAVVADGKKHADNLHNHDGNSADTVVQDLASDWRNRLEIKPETTSEVSEQSEQPSATDENAPAAISELDDIIKMVTQSAASSDNVGTAEQFESSHDDESENARPLNAGVENDATDIGKEKQMQTAAQLKPISESGISENIDLRDTNPATEASVTTLVTDSMASLFGPVIEDDVKGVRNQIRELIQCEMQGELGQRFSRNLRIVIRREIAAAIDDQFDRV